MDFRRLKYFVTVAEELNIGRAAQRLHISQPPLTRQIHLLEEDMGVELFVRSSRGVELTQAGELFLEDARNIQTILAQAHEKAQKAAANLKTIAAAIDCGLVVSSAALSKQIAQIVDAGEAAIDRTGKVHAVSAAVCEALDGAPGGATAW